MVESSERFCAVQVSGRRPRGIDDFRDARVKKHPAHRDAEKKQRYFLELRHIMWQASRRPHKMWRRWHNLPLLNIKNTTATDTRALSCKDARIDLLYKV